MITQDQIQAILKTITAEKLMRLVSDFTCPFTNEIAQDPVSLPKYMGGDGKGGMLGRLGRLRVYDRKELAEWLKSPCSELLKVAENEQDMESRVIPVTMVMLAINAVIQSAERRGITYLFPKVENEDGVTGPSASAGSAGSEYKENAEDVQIDLKKIVSDYLKSRTRQQLKCAERCLINFEKFPFRVVTQSIMPRELCESLVAHNLGQFSTVFIQRKKEQNDTMQEFLLTFNARSGRKTLPFKVIENSNAGGVIPKIGKMIQKFL